MRLLVPLLTLALALAGCDGDRDTRPDAPLVDLAPGERLTFPDTGGRDATPDLVLPPDASTRDTGVDAAPDAALPDLAAPDLAAPDLAAPDLAAPDLAAPAPCSVYADFTCSQSSSTQCSATCQTATTTFAITCTWSSWVALCSCLKDGTGVKFCARVGTGCAPCQNAFSCCSAAF